MVSDEWRCSRDCFAGTALLGHSLHVSFKSYSGAGLYLDADAALLEDRRSLMGDPLDECRCSSDCIVWTQHACEAL